MKLIVPFVALAIAASSQAQSTWKGLHFNESRDEVRQQMTAQGIALEQSQEGTLQSTSDYQLLLPNLRDPLPMFLGFHFNDAGALTDVVLTVDVQGMHRYWGTLGPDEALLNFAADKIAGSISGRYGTPIYRSPGCEAEAKAPANFCTVSWHGQEQTVEMERAPSPRGSRLSIRYQPLATDL